MSTVAVSAISGPAEILQRLAQGDDEEAWTALIRDEGGRLYRIARSVLGDHAASEDAVQEALLHIRKGASRFVPPASGDTDEAARAWLYRVTVSAARMWARGERRRQARERVVGDAPRSAPAQPDQRLPDLRAAIADLPEAQRVPLVLHHLGGQDYDAIGSALGISSGTARVRVHRALTQLRKRLAGAAGLTAMTALLQSLGASEGGPSAAALARWEAIPSASLTPVATSATIFGGITVMAKLGIVCASLSIAGLLTVTALPASAAEGGGKEEPRKEEPRKEEPRKEVEVVKEAPDHLAEGTKGVSTGTIVSLAKGKLVLATEGGNIPFMPHWTGGMPKDGGGPDKKMLATLEGFKVGQKVRIEWVWSERRRIESIAAQ